MISTASVVVLCGVIVICLARGEREPALAKSLENLCRAPPPPLPQVEINRRAAAVVHTKWIEQKLDNFNGQDKRAWQMRYLENDEYFTVGGPIFIYVGGEWSVTADRIQYGIINDLAKEYRGILFHTEHRYYGESRPTGDLSVRNLQYLHVRQALADLAHFIRFKRSTDHRLANSKVILTGCSYSASMAVWFKKLYPDLVDGSWASSAPITARVDFKEYNEIVGQAFHELGSRQCYQRIENGIARLEAMFAGNRGGQAKRMLNLCRNFDHENSLDLWSLFSALGNIFAGIVQFQREGDVPQWCNSLMSFSDDLSAIIAIFINQLSTGPGCIDATYKNTLIHFRNNAYNGPFRPFRYQTCNEFGWFQTSTSRRQPFGSLFPEALYTRLCYDIFGARFTPGNIYRFAAETNEFFGGANSPKVYLTYGELDPWKALNENVTLGVTVIPGASHCADFGSLSKSDNYEMRASKERLARLVGEWLA